MTLWSQCQMNKRGSDQQRKLIVDCPIKVCGTAIPSPFSYSPHCYISPAVQIYKGSWAGKTKHKVGSRNKQGPALEFDQVEIWPQCIVQNSWLWFFRPRTIWHPEFKHLQHGFGLQKCRIYVLCEKKKTHTVLGRLTTPSHYTRKVILEEWGLKDELLVIWWIDFLDISYNNKLEKEGHSYEEDALLALHGCLGWQVVEFGMSQTNNQLATNRHWIQHKLWCFVAVCFFVLSHVLLSSFCHL